MIRILVLIRVVFTVFLSAALADDLRLDQIERRRIGPQHATTRTDAHGRPENLTPQKNILTLQEDILNHYPKGRPILIFTDTWKERPGGVLKVLEALQDQAQSVGIQIVFIHPGNVPSYKLKSPRFQNASLSYLSFTEFNYLIQELNPIAIHIATEGSLGVEALLYAKLKGLPVTTAYHTRIPEYGRERYGIPESLGEFFVRWFHSKSSGILAPSPNVNESLSKIGIDESLIRPWSHGVDTNLFHPRAAHEYTTKIPDLLKDLPRPFYLTLGRVSPEKNLEAFLKTDVPGTKIVVGDGPSLNEYKQRAQNGEFKNTIFLGSMDGVEKSEIYSHSDVFVFPSRTDTVGLVLLEAMASGLPIAALPSLAASDLLTPEIGVISENLGWAMEQTLKLSREDCRIASLERTWKISFLEFLSHLQILSKDNRVPNTVSVPTGNRCIQTILGSNAS